MWLLWSHSEWTHHAVGGSMQSSPTKGSKHWSCQRSGDHEETVKVPHTTRVCIEDKGTTWDLKYLCVLLGCCKLILSWLYWYIFLKLMYSCTGTFIWLQLPLFPLLSCFVQPSVENPKMTEETRIYPYMIRYRQINPPPLLHIHHSFNEICS